MKAGEVQGLGAGKAGHKLSGAEMTPTVLTRPHWTTGSGMKKAGQSDLAGPVLCSIPAPPGSAKAAPEDERTAGRTT